MPQGPTLPSMRHAVVKVKGKAENDRSFTVTLNVVSPWTDQAALAVVRYELIVPAYPNDHYGILQLPEAVLRRSRQG